MRSLVTGATGFVGQALVKRLDQPVVMGRSQKSMQQLFGDIPAFVWDPSAPLDQKIFKGVDTVFHLAGESVFKGRWNTEKKNRIFNSRIDGTRNLVESMSRLNTPPSTLVCASAIGYYGDRGDTLLPESAPPGDDFLAEVCTAWENEAAKAEDLGIRVVQVRIGVVLGKNGGALHQMLTPFRFGVGGKIGSGKQYMSWIHVDDLVGIMLYCARMDSIKGPVNGVAPDPVTNSEFTKTLASVLHRPAIFPVPGGALKILLGEFSEVLLGSQRIIPEKISEAGYTFMFPDIRTALQNLLGKV